MRIRFAFDPFGPFCSWLMAVGAAFSLYCFIVCQAAADPAAWQHHGIYQLPITFHQSPPPCLPFASHPKNGSFRALEMNYKETLNLPKTDFPMKANLTTREPEILAKWESIGLYEQIQERSKDAPLFVLHDGPPFANGDRKSTRLNSSHTVISYAVFCLKKKNHPVGDRARTDRSVQTALKGLRPTRVTRVRMPPTR